MRVTVFCHGHVGARVRLLDGTIKLRYQKGTLSTLVSEAEEAANTVELDEHNFYCSGDVAKAEHKFGYYITV